MSDTTNIEWTDHTFNPWEGCQKVAPECDNCYAETRDKRFTGGLHWGPKAPRRRTSIQNWNKPIKWHNAAHKFMAEHGRRPRVFCASLADVFDNAVDPEWRADLFDLIRKCFNLDWQLLTKRPQNMVKMLPADWGDGWANVWLGISAGSQKTAEQNIPHLLATPAAVRFVSAEPLLGAIDLTSIARRGGTGLMRPLDGRFSKLDWVIVGGESGPNARPMHPDWAQSIRDQCVNAGVPFLFKQWGEWAPGENSDVFTGYRANAKWWNEEWLFGETNMADPEADWDDEPDLYRIGKKAAGRLLDGREWSQFPASGMGVRG